MEEIEFEGGPDRPVVAASRDDDPVDPPWSRRLRWALGIGFGLIAAVVVVQVVVGERAVDVAGQADPQLGTDIDPTTEASPSASPPPAPTREVPIDQAPPPPRANTTAVQVLAPPPLSPIRAHVTLAANEHGIVAFGGVRLEDRKPFVFVDAAFYNFATAAWTKMAASPFSDDEFAARTSAVWVGDELIVFRGDTGGAWDRTSDSWRELASAGRTVDALVPMAAEGELPLLLGMGAHAIYDVAADSWQPFSGIVVGELDGSYLAEQKVVVDTPEDLLLVSAWGQIQTVLGGVDQIGIGTWSGTAVDAAWTGTDVVIVTDDRDAVLYDPQTNEIRRLPPVPLLFDTASVRVDLTDEGRIVVNEVAVFEDCCGWVVSPYPSPGNSHAGAVRHDGALWRLGVVDDQWSFTRLDDSRPDLGEVVALGSASLDLRGSLELLNLTTSVLPAEGTEAGLREFIVASVADADTTTGGQWLCELVYSAPEQPRPVTRADADSRMYRVGDDGSGVTVDCPAEADVQQVLAAISW